MEFPITELLDEKLSTQWLLKHFHPDGLQDTQKWSGGLSLLAVRANLQPVQWDRVWAPKADPKAGSAAGARGV